MGKHKYIAIVLSTLLLAGQPLVRLLGRLPDQLFEERESEEPGVSLSDGEGEGSKKVNPIGGWHGVLEETSSRAFRIPTVGVVIEHTYSPYTSSIPFYILYQQLRLNPGRI